MSSSINDSYSILPENIFKFKQSHITIKTGYVVLFFSGCLLLIMGLAMFFLQIKGEGYTIDYTDCKSVKDEKIFCRNATNILDCTCEVQINITESMHGQVFFYYQLIDFNQNIRTYASSYDSKQLMGSFARGLIPSTACMAMEKVGDQYIVPCGLVANSMFNDTFTLFDENKDKIPLKITRLGISSRFRNPKDEPLEKALEDYTNPPNWDKPIYELDPDNPANNGLENFHFISWMSIYPFNDVIKLYGLIDHHQKYLPSGVYTVSIDYNFVISDQIGRKLIRIHNLGVLGSRNIFLSITYMTCAIISLTFAFIFFVYVKMVSL